MRIHRLLLLLALLATGCTRTAAGPDTHTPDPASSQGGEPAPVDGRFVGPDEHGTTLGGATTASVPLVAPDESRLAAPDVPTHALGALPPVQRVERDADLGHEVPYQVFPHVPGRVVGVLVMTGRQPYGNPVGHGADAPFDDEHVERDEYRFGFAGSSPYAQYFPSRGEGANFLAGWSVPIDAERTFPTDAAMFDRETPNRFGLTRRAHLVELEVNGGAGGEGVHFVATDVRVLDGTPAFPPRLDALLVALRDDFVRETDDEARASMAAFQAARDANPEVGFGPMRTRVVLHPTYRPDERTIDVFFRRERVATGQGPARFVETRCPRCPPGAPCARCDPHPRAVRDEVTTRFEVSGRYVVDAGGRVVARRIAPARTETTSIAPDGVDSPDAP